MEVSNAQENALFCEDTIKMLTKTQVAYLVLAKRLEEIKVKKLYLPKWQSFQEFCMEMNELSTTQVSRLLSIREKFIKLGGIEEEKLGEAGWTKLAMTLPYVKTADEASHWFERAKTLTRTDLQREIKELQTGKSMATCDHEKSYLVSICEDCGDKRRVYDIAILEPQAVKKAIETYLGIEVGDYQLGKIVEDITVNAYETAKSLQSGD